MQNIKAEITLLRCAFGRTKLKVGRPLVHAIEMEEALFIMMVQSESKQVRNAANEVHSVGLQSEAWIGPLLVNDTIVPFKLDTGANAFKVRPKIQTMTVALKAYNGQSFEKKGTRRLKVSSGSL